ncbi:MAG TPA: DUF4232 domain-containing protein [Solirubrobacteraceae bacterium]|nr:DUF4232 domain-containing protein [Solirubrobacteraceae bacterium]
MQYKWFTGAVALACATTLAPMTPVAATASPATWAGAAAAASTPRCATSGLVIWLDTQGSGAAGSTYYRIELTNLSGHTCTLVGYPRVAAVNLGGHQLGSGSIHYVSRMPLVTLANRATASVVLEIIDVDNFSASACRPVTAAGLRVFPPKRNASKVIPFPFRACSRTGPEYLTAAAVQPHQ